MFRLYINRLSQLPEPQPPTPAHITLSWKDGPEPKLLWESRTLSPLPGYSKETWWPHRVPEPSAVLLLFLEIVGVGLD